VIQVIVVMQATSSGGYRSICSRPRREVLATSSGNCRRVFGKNRILTQSLTSIYISHFSWLQFISIWF